MVLGKAVVLLLLLTGLVVSGNARGPCDPLTPEYCQLPFPNSFFTRPDADSPTDVRVNMSADTWPKDSFGRGLNPVHWNTMGKHTYTAADMGGARIIHEQ